MPKPKSKLGDQPIPIRELKTPAEHDLSHQRDARCVPVAGFIIKLVADMPEIPCGSHVKNDEVKEKYLPVARSIMSELVNKNVKITEIVYIFSLIQQVFGLLSDTIDETLNQNMNRITELVYNLPVNDYNEVSVKNLNDVVLKADKISEVWKPIIERK